MSLEPFLMIHSHCVFPSPQLKLVAGSQESSVWTRARLPGKGPLLHISFSICKLRRQKWCLTHRGDRRNYQLMWVKPLKMKGLYEHVNYNFYQPCSLCILSCHSGLFCASQSSEQRHSTAWPHGSTGSIQVKKAGFWTQTGQPTVGRSSFPLLRPKGKSKPTTWAGKIK